jgi:hypothetical protein
MATPEEQVAEMLNLEIEAEQDAIQNASTAPETATETVEEPKEGEEPAEAGEKEGEKDGDGAEKPPDAAAAPEKPWTEARVKEEAEKLTSERAEFDAAKTKLEEETREFYLKRNDLAKKSARMNDREQKFNVKLSRFKEEQKQRQSFSDWVSANVRQLREGDTEAKLRAMGTLAGADPIKFYEELSIGMASNGQKTAGGESAEVKALREEMARDREERRRADEERNILHRKQQEAQQYQQFRHETLELAKASEAHPTVARLAAARPDFVADRAVAVAMSFYQQNGYPLDKTSILGMIEEDIRPLTELSQPATALNGKNGTTTSAVDTARDTVASAEPAQAQRPPNRQSIPQALGSSGKQIPMSEQERLRAVEEMIPDDLFAHLTGR